MARLNGKDRGLFLKKDKWCIRWACCVCGIEHRESVGTKSLALQLYERRKTATKFKGFCLTEAKAMLKREANSSFDKVAERYLEWAREHRERSTEYREWAIGQLAKSFGNKNMADITAQAFGRHQKRRQAAGVAPATINHELAVLSHMFTMAIKWELVDDNPVSKIEPLKVDNVKPRPITKEEEQRLFAVLPEHYKPIVTFALNTGLRLGELQHQRWEDVDIASGVLTVSRPKSGKREQIPLNTTAFAVLMEADQSGEYVFPRMPKQMSSAFRRYTDKAGVDASFHDLRDTFISRLAPNVNPIILMKLARHRDFKTTQRYLKLDDAQLRQAVELLVSGQNGELTVTKTVTGISYPTQDID